MEIELAYQETLDTLYSYVDYSLTRNFRYTPDKFDLGRMVQFMALLGNPQERYAVIHVAGTKGKGSTAAMIASALRSAGLRTGFYTSPHLHDYCERIQVDGVPISHAEFVALFEEIRPAIHQVERLTTFEITTAMAFLYYARKGVDAAAIEVGLGGRLDATNVVTPLVSVITSLSMDHMNVLGDTLAKIAAEKAGIIKAGRPVVVSPQTEEARLVVERVAAERSAPLTQVGRDYHFAALQHNLDGQDFAVWQAHDQEKMNTFIEAGETGDWQPARLHIPLLGYHQVQNAVTAYAALQAARAAGLPVDEQAIRDGFASVVWPGRFELLQREPMVLIDSAHNRDSALKLRLALDDYLPGQPVILLFGASEDKDVSGMFAELMPRVQRVIATQSVHPRAMEAEKLVEMAHSLGKPALAVVPVEKALETAIRAAKESGAVAVATGSLFIAAAVRDAWLERQTTL